MNMTASHSIVTLPCGCFFRGREFVVDSQCTEHRDDDAADEAVFSFEHLSPRAKENARADYRENGLNYDWWDDVFEDVIRIAPMMGIELDLNIERLADGRQFHSAAIYFRGFNLQGDGACFTGDWVPVDDPLASLSAVMAHAPTDDRLHEIALALAHMSERCNALIPGAKVTISRGRSSYCHPYSVDIDVDLPTPDSLDEDNGLQVLTFNALCRRYGLEYETFEPEITHWLRTFMDWIYRQLEAEYDHLTSDEVVDDMLSDHKFDEEGNIVG